MLKKWYINRYNSLLIRLFNSFAIQNMPNGSFYEMTNYTLKSHNDRFNFNRYKIPKRELFIMDADATIFRNICQKIEYFPVMALLMGLRKVFRF